MRRNQGRQPLCAVKVAPARLREAAFEQRLTSRVLPKTGLQHVTHDHFIHALGIELCALKCCLNHDCAEVDGAGGRQRAVKAAYCGTCRADDDTVFHLLFLKSEGCRQNKVNPMTKMIPEKSRAVMQ